MKTLIFTKILLSAMTILFLLSSCKDLLEEKIRSQLPLDIVDGKALIVDTYDRMASLASDRQWYLMTETTTDNCNFVGTNTVRRQFMSYKMDAGNNQFSGMWDILYSGIASANTVISRIDSSGVDLEERERIKGEAKFLRALNYFHAVRFWGDIPMLLKPAQAGDVVNVKTPSTQIYNLIIADLKSAEEVLPESYQGLNEGRVTHYAASALLGKVYLTRASTTKYNPDLNIGGSLADYDSAKVCLKKVIESNRNLVPQYSDNFNILTEYNSEVIFDIKCFTNGPYRNTNRGAADWAANPNLYGGNSYAQTAMTKDLYSLFEPDDTRRNLLVRGPYTTILGQNHTTTLYTRNGDSSYGNLIFSWKFLDSKNPAADGGVGEGFQLGGVNYPVIRYADVLLMLAEAELETGSPERAIIELNKVRERAGAGSVNTVSLASILEERRRELYLEGHRWFDLVRTATLKERVETAAQLEGSLIHYDASVIVDLPKHYLFPIPRREVDLGLIQNFGY